MSDYHIPVLLQEVIQGLSVKSGCTYIDATVGGGGHAIEIVKHGGKLLGLDTDGDAIEETKRNLKARVVNGKEGKDWVLVQSNFRDIEATGKRMGFEKADGILFDLGVSSHQLDTPERGFSYRFGDNPLDLRLNKDQGESAAELIDRSSEHELYEIFTTYGEEERAWPIVRALGRARAVKRIKTTGDLVEAIENALPKGPAKFGALSRIFQGLRIAVNDEFGALKTGLAGAKTLLAPGGRLAVISFHSLEDRIVKQFMRANGWQVITKKPITATDEELAINGRARSAKLRIAQKL